MRLKDWMHAKGMTSHEFSVLVANQLGRNYFSPKNVENWAQGIRYPRRSAMQAIVAITEYEVTANDFLT
jgi:hypothetical protein